MKHLLLILSILCNSLSLTQTLLRYDYIETNNWANGWSVGYGNNTGFYTNAFVSSNASAALIGTGNGTSPIEEGVYILSNVTSLNNTYEYELRFRLGSYKFGGPSATTAGTDVPDYLLLYVSYDNAATLIQEIKITGYNNTLYNYGTTQLYKFANGTLTTYSTQTNQYSDIRLRFTNTTQFTARVYVRVNSLGEEWWMDNFELWQITTPLPVELSYFDCDPQEGVNKIIWETATEQNSSHFIVERSEDGLNWIGIAQVSGAINSTVKNHYVVYDYDYKKIINYYRLIQYDFDGKYETYDPISIDNSESSIFILKMINLFGQEIDQFYKGTVIIIYSDGSSKKIIR